MTVLANDFVSSWRPPWRDHRGAVSPLKATALLLLMLPAILLAVAWGGDRLGAEPVEALQDEAGRWALRLLLLSLAVTPVRLLWRWNGLIRIRRLIGLAALAYAFAHLLFYVALQDWVWAKVAAEIGTRVYLTIGASALLGLIVLGLTSTDGAVRRLGARRWQALHRLVYPIAILATVHFFLQTRLDPSEAMVMSGLLLWLLAARIWRWRVGRLGAVAALTLALAATGATAIGEAVYFHLRFGVDLGTLLATNLSAATGIRPAWPVGALTLALALVAIARTWTLGNVSRRRSAGA